MQLKLQPIITVICPTMPSRKEILAAAGDQRRFEAQTYQRKRMIVVTDLAWEFPEFHILGASATNAMPPASRPLTLSLSAISMMTISVLRGVLPTR